MGGFVGGGAELGLSAGGEEGELSLRYLSHESWSWSPHGVRCLGLIARNSELSELWCGGTEEWLCHPVDGSGVSRL